jgi:hypothetical protein
MDATVAEKKFGERLLSLRDVDARRVPLRKVLSVARRLEQDLGSDPSTAQSELIRRASVLAAMLEDTEARLLLGQEVSVSDYLAAASVQKRLLEALGLERVPRDVMSLSELLRQDREQQRRLEEQSTA